MSNSSQRRRTSQLQCNMCMRLWVEVKECDCPDWVAREIPLVSTTALPHLHVHSVFPWVCSNFFQRHKWFNKCNLEIDCLGFSLLDRSEICAFETSSFAVSTVTKTKACSQKGSFLAGVSYRTHSWDPEKFNIDHCRAPEWVGLISLHCLYALYKT